MAGVQVRELYSKLKCVPNTHYTQKYEPHMIWKSEVLILVTAVSMKPTYYLNILLAEVPDKKKKIMWEEHRDELLYLSVLTSCIGSPAFILSSQNLNSETTKHWVVWPQLSLAVTIDNTP